MSDGVDVQLRVILDLGGAQELLHSLNEGRSVSVGLEAHLVEATDPAQDRQSHLMELCEEFIRRLEGDVQEEPHLKRFLETS